MKRSVPEVVPLQMTTRPLCVGSTECTGVTTILCIGEKKKASSGPKKRAVVATLPGWQPNRRRGRGARKVRESKTVEAIVWLSFKW